MCLEKMPEDNVTQHKNFVSKINSFILFYKIVGILDNLKKKSFALFSMSIKDYS